jgi:hypothetical protein
MYGGRICAYRFWWRNLKEGDDLEDRWEGNIKMDLQEVGWGAYTGLFWFRIVRSGVVFKAEIQLCSLERVSE